MKRIYGGHTSGFRSAARGRDVKSGCWKRFQAHSELHQNDCAFVEAGALCLTSDLDRLTIPGPNREAQLVLSSMCRAFEQEDPDADQSTVCDCRALCVQLALAWESWNIHAQVGKMNKLSVATIPVRLLLVPPC